MYVGFNKTLLAEAEIAYNFHMSGSIGILSKMFQPFEDAKVSRLMGCEEAGIRPWFARQGCAVFYSNHEKCAGTWAGS